MSQETDPNGIDQHAPGAKLDAGKPNLALVFGGFHQSLREVGDVGTYGATKYSPNGWKEVSNAEERYLSAALRHILAYLGGERNDPDTGINHLAHASWNTLASRQSVLSKSEPEKSPFREQVTSGMIYGGAGRPDPATCPIDKLKAIKWFSKKSYQYHSGQMDVATYQLMHEAFVEVMNKTTPQNP